MRTGSYGRNDWRNWGYMTRDAVHALMADIYLWRASMNHSASDYQQAIALTDSVINAKDAYYKLYQEREVTAKEEDRYHLIDGDKALNSIFSSGNSRESILELQYNGRNNSNQALENYYYQSGNENSYRSTSILMASQLFSTVATNANTSESKKFYCSKNDYRFWNNVYEANNEEAQQLSIRKMVDDGGSTIEVTSNVGPRKSNSRQFKEFQQNWIVYRLTDIMLMQAEALVETAASDSDIVTLKKAFDLVQAVNMCFEGKRCFDLMRFCYRHMEGVNGRQRLADTESWPALYKPMLLQIVRKYVDSGGDAISYKMKTEPYLYWPIQESELKVNNLLKQNPVFIQEKSTSKN